MPKTLCSTCSGSGTVVMSYVRLCSCDNDPDCSDCHGSGTYTETAIEDCYACGGSGYTGEDDE